MVEIRLLGRFSVRRDGEEIPATAFGGRLTRALVRLLASRRGEFVSVDVAAEALWPGRLPADPGANLRVLVNRARTALGEPSLILTGGGGYAFAGGDVCVVDAERFLSLVADGRAQLDAGHAGAALRAFSDALAVWGEPLAEDAYAEWATGYRRRLGRAHLDALGDGAAAALALRDPARAVTLAEEAARAEPLNEALNLLLARALGGAGDSVGALRVIDGLRRRLREDVGLDPSPDVEVLERRILAGESLGPVGGPAPDFARAPVAFSELAFVGRDLELEGLLDELSRGAPEVAVVSGAAGTGKSRLLAELAKRLGAPVLGARAFAGERDEAWSLARTLLREAVALDLDVVAGLEERAAGALTSILPELADLRRTDVGALDGESRRALALEAGVRVLDAVSAKGALVFADDLQWADPTSLSLLGAALARLPRLGAVLAYRPEEAAANPALVSFLEGVAPRVGLGATVALRSLPRPAVGELVADDLLETLCGATDGSPFAISEVVRALASQGLIGRDADGRWRARSPEAVGVAADVAQAGQRRAIAGRVGRQPAAARNILALLALLARETPARLLAAATGDAQAAVLGSLDSLGRAGLARLGESGWAPAHDLVGELVAEGLDPGRRAAFHLSLAQALEVDDDDPAEIAYHLARSGDGAAAAHAYSRAARQRLDRHAATEAVTLATSGLGLDPATPIRRELLLVRAEGRDINGDRQSAREDLRAALALAPAGTERSVVLTRLANLTMGEDVAAAADLIDMALTEAGPARSARAEALTVGAYIDATAGRLERARDRSTEALGLFEALGDGLGRARILDAQVGQAIMAGNVREAASKAGRAAQLYVDSGRLALAGYMWSAVSLGSTLMGRPDEALTAAEAALELERTLGQAEGEACALMVLAGALDAVGRTEEGGERMRAARALFSALGESEWSGFALVSVAWTCEAAGDLAQAEVLLREVIEVARDYPFPRSLAAARLSSVRLLRGDAADAEVWARQAREILPLGRLEADLVLAEIALARCDPGGPRRAAAALEQASACGWLASPTYRRLTAMVADHPGDVPGAAAARERATFMFTDIVGSTNLVEVLGDDAWGHLLAWHDDCLRSLFAAHRGREVNRIGDGFFVAFTSPHDALRCAVAVQRALDEHRRANGFAPAVRIGVHEAEVTRKGDDYEGKGVHVAARVGALADAGEILASRGLVAGIDQPPSSPPRSVTLKGLSDPLEVVSISWRP